MKHTHWHTSLDRPQFGQDLIALCGQTVPKAEPARAIWEPDSDGLVTCWGCNRQYSAAFVSRPHYVSVIVAGQEAMDEERTA